jgi:L-seryl-tRNA(Ser) seleniumtransferase
MGRSYGRTENARNGCPDERRPFALRPTKEFGRCIEVAEALSHALRRRYWTRRAICKTKNQSRSMKSSILRTIPSVDKLLNALGDTGLPRPIVVAAVRAKLTALRKAKTIPDFDALLSTLHGALREVGASRIQPVINGTGILIHTNFGRAPLGAAVIEALAKTGSNYNNLEYSLTGGARGGRAAYLEQSLALVCTSEAATVVNNNAAALILILRHFCKAGATSIGRRTNGKNRDADVAKNEVVISRGELIQIGGGFRIPEILESSGARLREVGTTNKTSLNDYARAIKRETALVLKVHRSNFYMGGFVESPRTEDIAELARKKRVPFAVDLGSGAIVETERIAGLEHETTPAELTRAGVDLICFSGDKLLGGPQAGIIAGTFKHVAALKKEPLFRALRCDKLILSTLEATVDLYLRGSGDFVTAPGIPVLEMLRTSNDELRTRANKILFAVKNRSITAAVGSGKSQVGGGTQPRAVIASVTIDLSHTKFKPQEIATFLRENRLPIIGYVARDKFKLDLRTIFPSQDVEVIEALVALSNR